jgi:hypothetical protein
MFVFIAATDEPGIRGQAAHAPGVIIHEQFALFVNGPVKITETQEPNR